MKQQKNRVGEVGPRRRKSQTAGCLARPAVGLTYENLAAQSQAALANRQNIAAFC